MPPPVLAAAAQAACLLELAAPKPGNVRKGHDRSGLTYGDLFASAVAIGPAFRRGAGGPVGRLILEAIRATRRQVGTNTNLGIVLLLAPLARAAADAGPVSFRDRLRRVLRRLTVRDARDAYRAIRLASPGGLGRVVAQDVARAPVLTLRRCMALAARRDAIAREYTTGFPITLSRALPSLVHLRAGRVPLRRAIAQMFLMLLAERPDTLIARRHGAEAARAVSREARRILAAGGLLSVRGRRMARAFDRRLRAAKPPINPGTTADLATAAIFLWLLAGGGAPGRLRRSA